MSRPVLLGCLLLTACEPVLLSADEGQSSSGHQASETAIADAASELSAIDQDAEPSGAEPSAAGAGSAPPSVQTDAASPQVQLSVKSVDCGSCYDLLASGTGGASPYRYEWDNGSRSDTRRVCVGANDLSIWVAVEDAAGARSSALVTRLQANAVDAVGCTTGVGASPAAVPMCLMNGSFEGTAAINTGGTFDAVPWSTCRDAAENQGNSPDIANDTLDPAMSGFAPQPTDGSTFLAMTTGEQASQKICQALNAGDKTFLKLDARYVELGGTEMFLQIWGGASADCSTRQLLWVSPALTNDWMSYCVPVQPGEFMDQITLRADQPMPNLVLNVAAVDNLQPVDSCP